MRLPFPARRSAPVRARPRSAGPRMLAAAGAMGLRASPACIAGQLAASVLAGLAPVAIAWMLRSVLDTLATGRGRGDLIATAMALATTAGLAALLPNVEQYLGARAGRAIETVTTAELFAAVSRLSGLRTLEDPSFQDRLRVAEQAGPSGPSQVLSGGISALQSALTLVGFLTSLTLVSPLLPAIVAATAAPAAFLQRGIARRQAALVSGMSHGQRRQFFYASLLTSLAAAKEIRLFGLGDFFRGRMLAEQRQLQHASDLIDRKTLVGNIALTATSALVAGGGLVWAVSACADGRLSVGDVSMFVAALAAVSASLAMIFSTSAVTYRALLLFGAYQDVLAQQPDLPVPANPVPVPAMRQGLELEDVWFRYGPDKPWVLRGVSLFIPHGCSVALVGLNGAGKTTLVKLLCRLYDPDHGRVLWDGTDVRAFELSALRDRVSAVFQDYMTYELTAAENIGVGDLRLAADESALAAAAERADIHEKVQTLPRGYQTLLTRAFFDVADPSDPQTGVMLSGGQWQRVALARAYLRGRRDLMILDEPSSGLDPQAEHEIHIRLSAEAADRATVLISHRLSAVRHADLIVVLADGAVVEQGDHGALMARQGVYARLFSLQAAGYAEAAPVESGI
jgi:ATP-binding cassette, subfamily B, bacterial